MGRKVYCSPFNLTQSTRDAPGERVRQLLHAAHVRRVRLDRVQQRLVAAALQPRVGWRRRVVVLVRMRMPASPRLLLLMMMVVVRMRASRSIPMAAAAAAAWFPVPLAPAAASWPAPTSTGPVAISRPHPIHPSGIQSLLLSPSVPRRSSKHKRQRPRRQEHQHQHSQRQQGRQQRPPPPGAFEPASGRSLPGRCWCCND